MSENIEVKNKEVKERIIAGSGTNSKCVVFEGLFYDGIILLLFLARGIQIYLVRENYVIHFDIYFLLDAFLSALLPLILLISIPALVSGGRVGGDVIVTNLHLVFKKRIGVGRWINNAYSFDEIYGISRQKRLADFFGGTGTVVIRCMVKSYMFNGVLISEKIGHIKLTSLYNADDIYNALVEKVEESKSKKQSLKNVNLDKE